MTKSPGVVICGFGSIGRRHAANVLRLMPDARITVLRQRGTQTLASELPDRGVNVVYSLDEALAVNPEVALICNPAPFHVPTAQAFVDAGAHIFMEKPVSDSLDGIDHLLESSMDINVVFFVAYPLRYDTGLMAMREAVKNGDIGQPVSISAVVGQYLPDWRPEQDYRDSVTAQKSLGGGVLLELSHELDYVQWIMGDVTSVTAKLDKVSDLEIDVEDTADLAVEFSSGASGTVHLDMVRRQAVRSCTVTGTEGVVEWDGLESTTRIKSAGDDGWRELGPGSDDGNEKYVRELDHFFDCVSGNDTATSDGASGRRTIELILAARESAEIGKAVSL
jgi:predicted dehydrogenase